MNVPKPVTEEPVTPEEQRLFVSLRASSWSEFEGQEGVKRNLKIAIAAARKRKEPLEHILLYGPPGLGKTTIAHIISREMGDNEKTTIGPALIQSAAPV